MDLRIRLNPQVSDFLRSFYTSINVGREKGKLHSIINKECSIQTLTLILSTISFIVLEQTFFIIMNETGRI